MIPTPLTHTQEPPGRGARGAAAPPPGTPPVTGPGRPFPWLPIMAAYVLYVFATFLNDVLGTQRQLLGAVLFLIVLAACSVRRLLPLPLSKLNLALAAAALAPLLAQLSGLVSEELRSVPYTVKYYSLLGVILATTALRLPPLYRARERRLGLGALLVVLLVGWLTGVPTERVEGSFVNPNNFALAALSLLFFVDHTRDSRRLLVTVHVLTAGLLLLSGTTGALISYGIGLCVYLPRTSFARWGYPALVGGLILALLAPGFLSARKLAVIEESRLLGPIWTKMYITRVHYGDLQDGGDVNFWDLSKEYGGSELTSSLWRLSQWRETILEFQRSGWPARLLGHGFGSSVATLGKLPHNDYLRLLFETGLCGLAANVIVWGLLFRRARPGARWPAVTMAIYTFTENNLDNFLVMSLFAMWMVSAGHDERPARRPSAAHPETAT